jgi:hypothetical protein
MFAGTVAGLIADHQHFLRSNRAGVRLSAVLSAQVRVIQQQDGTEKKLVIRLGKCGNNQVF